MDYKKQIEFLLESIKQHGYDRAAIEKEMGYSENYIDQQLSKGGNKRFVSALESFRSRVLQNAIDKSSREAVLNQMDLNTKSTITDILFQQNKLLIALQQQSAALQEQSLTSNNILKRLADNVEVKVDRIDVNVIDTLGKVNKIVSHLSGEK